MKDLIGDRRVRGSVCTVVDSNGVSKRGLSIEKMDMNVLTNPCDIRRQCAASPLACEDLFDVRP